MSAAPSIDGQFIGGEEIAGDGHDVVPRHDPADERIEVSRQRMATIADADDAIGAAAAAACEWARTPGPHRAAILHRAATLLEQQAPEAAREITAHEGKSIVEATGEVLRSAVLLRFFAEQARGPDGEIADAEELGTTIMARRRPLGSLR